MDTLFLHPPALSDVLSSGTTTVRTSTMEEDKCLSLGFWNISGQWTETTKLTFITGLIQTYNLDYLALVDSRDSVLASTWATTTISRVLPGFTAAVAPVQASTHTLIVGGITLLLGPRCSRPRPQLWQDKSGLGLVSGITMSTPTGALLVMAVYFPVQTASTDTGTDKLEVQLKNWLTKEKRQHQSPREYIWTSIQSKARKHLKTPGNRLVVGGDLNMLADEAIRELQIIGTVLMPFSHPSTDRPTRSVTEGARRIDHIAGVGTHFVTHTLHADPAYSMVSDHYPLSCTIIHESPAQLPLLPQLRRPKDLAIHNQRVLDRYQKAVTEFIESEPPPPLQELCEFSARVLQPKGAAKAFGSRHLWSPRMIALTWWHRLLRQVQRNIVDTSNRAQLTQECQQRICKIGSDGPALWHYVQTLGITERQLLACGLQDATALSRAIKETRRLSHAKARQAERDRITHLCKIREETLSNGRIRRAIQSLLPTERLMFDTSYLQLSPNDPPLLDPQIIYDRIAEHFRQWYALPDHPAERLPHDTWTRWSKNPESTMTYLTSLGIPLAPASLLSKGILATTESPSVIGRVFLDLISKKDVMPSMDEFIASIASTPDGKAPGPSGITYTMIKGWPLAVKEWAYQCLCTLWQGDNMGAWWSTKLLFPIPKDSNPTLATLRPIMLLEPLRKVWMRTVIKKISQSWERHHILSPAQYGFRPNRNTAQAIIQVVNAMEEAEEEASVIYLSSWDITRAFDSITRPVILLALQRLGVPPDLAHAIAYMDDDDLIYPATPWYRHNPTTAAPFSSEKGTGQGDVSSPILWCAFFDILLRTLELVPSDFQVRGANGVITVVGDTAYADDLLSISATASNLQSKADIVSAFAIAFGLDLALHKFRSSAKSWGTEHVVQAEGILIHTGAWRPHMVQFTMEPQIRYLGSIQSRSNRGEAEAQRLGQLVLDAAKSIATKRASPELSIMATTLVTQAKVNYAGQFGAWPLKMYWEWDRPIRKVIKLKLHALQSYPHALLEAPKAHGGLGITMTSTRVQESKWRLLHNALLSSDPQTRAAGEGLVERGARASGSSLLVSGSHIDAKQLPQGVTYWIRSLAEFLAISGSQLQSPPLWRTSILDAPIESMDADISPAVKTRLIQLGILRIGDIVHCPAGGAALLLFQFPPTFPMLHGLWPPGQIMGPRQALHFLPGQVWMRAEEDGTGRWIYADEVLGWSTIGLVIRRWALSTRPTRRTAATSGFLAQPIRCQLITPTRGGGSELTVIWSEAENHYTAKGILDCDRRHHSGLQRDLLGWHFIPSCTPTLASSPARDAWMPPVLSTGILASDASWKSDPVSLDPSAPSKQGIGIVMMSPTSPSTPIYSLSVDCNSLPNTARAYTLEAVALVLACIIASYVSVIQILSDCKSAVYVIRKRVSSGQRLLQIRRTIAATFPRPQVLWTRSHPEERLQRAEYTPEDWANYYSDKAADGTAVADTHHSIDLQTALTTCAAHYPGWASCRDSALEILTPLERYQQELMTKYLQGRHERHPQDGPWTKAALVFALQARGPLSLKQRVSTTNLFFARFDRDRRFRAQDIHPCGCGQGLAALPCWATSCTCTDNLAIKHTLRLAIQTATNHDSALRERIFQVLFTQPDIRAWRGNWSFDAFQHLKLSKYSIKTLSTVTGLIIEASLEMHSLATSKDRTNAPTPARAASSISRRSTILRRSQLESRQLTDFGFTLGRSGTATSTSSSVWEPP